MAILGSPLGGPVLGSPELGINNVPFPYTRDVTVNVSAGQTTALGAGHNETIDVSSGVTLLKAVGYFADDVGVTTALTVTASAGYSHDATINVSAEAIKDDQLVYGKNISLEVINYFAGKTTPDDQAGVLGGAHLAVPVLGLLDLNAQAAAGEKPRIDVTTSKTFSQSVAHVVQKDIPLSFTYGIDVTKLEQPRVITKPITHNMRIELEALKGMAPTLDPVGVTATWNADAFTFRFAQQTYTDTDIMQLPVNVVLAHKYLFKKHGETVERRDPNYKFERMASRRTGVKRIDRNPVAPSFTTTTNKKGYD